MVWKIVPHSDNRIIRQLGERYGKMTVLRVGNMRFAPPSDGF